MAELLSWLKERAKDDLLLWADQLSAANRFKISVREVEGVALENGLLPARYQRNRNMFCLDDQLKFYRSKVTVIGCGGLGGYIIEELARLGVGTIVAVDPDVFEEHNMNRQLLATPDFLGIKKVAAAARRVDRVNPAVELLPVGLAFSRDNGKQILEDSQVAVDALDSIAVRLELAEVCQDLGIPLVHGAIAGWYGYLMTQFPGERTLQKFFSHNSQEGGLEKQLGNPSFTPAVVASLEVAEACKILLNRGTLARRRCLSIDLYDMEFVEIEC
jgi:molybdopterin/thiamine biosynthesis adenylyltransferase